MNDAPKSQDDHPGAALRGEPEVVGHERFEAAMKLFYRACGAWSDVRFGHPHASAGEIDLDKVKQAGLAEAAARTAITELFNESARPPQAASGCSHTARSDVLSIDVVEQRLLTWRQRFMNKSGDRLALDDFMGQESIDDLIDFVCSPPAQSADQGATPPAPAAQIRALISKWRHAADHLGLEGLASLADCADELESALAASPQPAAPEIEE